MDSLTKQMISILQINLDKPELAKILKEDWGGISHEDKQEIIFQLSHEYHSIGENYSDMQDLKESGFEYSDFLAIKKWLKKKGVQVAQYQ